MSEDLAWKTTNRLRSDLVKAALMASVTVNVSWIIFAVGNAASLVVAV